MSPDACRAVVSAVLARIQVGSLTVVEAGRRRVYGTGAPAATVHVRSARTWSMLLRGSRGLAESYAQGLWSGRPGESHPRAPADPGVTVPRHRALLTSRQ